VHLSHEELVEHLDGALRADRAAHLDVCERCRREAEGLAATLRDARRADVPEPSPLFWDHFSARVRDAIDAGPEGTASRWTAVWAALRGPGVGRAVFAGGAVAALLIVALLVRRAPQAPPPATAIQDAAAIVEPMSAADPEWALFVTVTDDVDWDTAHQAGLGVRPGTAERAALQLSEEDQIELARLLRAELKRPRS
jgi:hypothetical protein